MNNNLIIVGAGAYGSVVKETAEAINVFGQISFVDDFCKRDDVAGTTDMLESLMTDYRYAIVAVGDSRLRKSLFDKLDNYGYEIVSLIHPKAYMSPSAKIGRGCVIEPMAVVHSNAIAGDGCLVCAGSIINHNAVVEDFCQIDCNAVIGAGAKVSEETKISYGEIVMKR